MRNFADANTGFAQVPQSFMDLPPHLLSEVIRRMEGSRGDFSVPIWRASLAGDFRVAVALPGGVLPVKVTDAARPPTLIILSGDPDFPAPTPTPGKFRHVGRYLAWASSVVIHATGGTREHYAAIAAAVPIMRRVLLIETGTSMEGRWMEQVQIEAERRGRRGQRLPYICWSATLHGGWHPVREAAR